MSAKGKKANKSTIKTNKAQQKLQMKLVQEEKHSDVFYEFSFISPIVFTFVVSTVRSGKKAIELNVRKQRQKERAHLVPLEKQQKQQSHGSFGFGFP